MSLIPYIDDDEDKKVMTDVMRQYPLLPTFAPPTDHPLDPNNDLMPPGYVLPLANMMSGPPEIEKKRYFSFTVEDIDMFEKMKLKKWIKVYEKVLGMCFRKIRDHVIHGHKYCIFQIPEYLPGFPIYNMTHCCAFVINKLRKARFKAEYVQPNYVAIFWHTLGQPRIDFKEKLEKEVKDVKEDRNIHFVKLSTSERVTIEPKKRTYGTQKEEPFLFN